MDSAERKRNRLLEARMRIYFNQMAAEKALEKQKAETGNDNETTVTTTSKPATAKGPTA